MGVMYICICVRIYLRACVLKYTRSCDSNPKKRNMALHSAEPANWRFPSTRAQSHETKGSVCRRQQELEADCIVLLLLRLDLQQLQHFLPFQLVEHLPLDVLPTFLPKPKKLRCSTERHLPVATFHAQSCSKFWALVKAYPLPQTVPTRRVLENWGYAAGAAVGYMSRGRW